MPEIVHCWFSPKMHAAKSHFSDELGRESRDVIYRLLNGQEVLITLANRTKEHRAKWDDLQYLGLGTFSRTVEFGTFSAALPSFFAALAKDPQFTPLLAP